MTKLEWEAPATGDAALKLQMASLEATQARAVREFICGDTTALARLKAINDQIGALRAQLKNPGV